MNYIDNYEKFKQIIINDCLGNTQRRSDLINGLNDYEKLARLFTPTAPKKVEETVGSYDVTNGTRTYTYYVCPNCENIIDDESIDFESCIECGQRLDFSAFDEEEYEDE